MVYGFLHSLLLKSYFKRKTIHFCSNAVFSNEKTKAFNTRTPPSGIQQEQTNTMKECSPIIKTETGVNKLQLQLSSHASIPRQAALQQIDALLVKIVNERIFC